YIICTGLVPSRVHLYFQVEAGRSVRAYEDFVILWRQCADAIDESVIDDRNNIYHADKPSVDLCPSFIFNSRYMCKHLVSYYSVPRPDISGKDSVRAPPRCTPDLFQERLPLIQFEDDFDLSGVHNVNPTVGSTDCLDSVPVVQSSNYMEELKSLQLLPSGDPEAQEENDERLWELLRIMQLAAGESHSNQRMQCDLGGFIREQEEFIARYKRPYEEAMGRKRSADSQTMRKAQ
ncbi:uncharacterized protein V1513DRAFT_385343, partial [Lipomyces chichibuensis]|uniref:uncharacterized protein n=1 Tax=Lipomyces chichibuensis TaxID=1546026 RepID=UPI0033431132